MNKNNLIEYLEVLPISVIFFILGIYLQNMYWLGEHNIGTVFAWSIGICFCFSAIVTTLIHIYNTNIKQKEVKK